MKNDVPTSRKSFQAELVRPGRRFLTSLADLFLFYIITASIYLLGIYPLTKNLPSFKSAQNNQEVHLTNCRNMYIDGHLTYYDQTGDIMSSDVLIHRYVNDKANKGDLDESGNYYDPFYYFYLSYANENLKSGGETLIYNTDYLKNNVYNINNQNEPILWDASYDGVVRLTEDARTHINKYMNNDITAENKNYYDKISSFYKNALVEAEKVLINSDQYIKENSIVMKENQIIFYHFTISSIITYVTFHFLYFLLVPALFKNGQTFADRVLKIIYVNKEDKPISFSTLLLKSILRLLSYFFMPLFIPYLILGNAIFVLPLLTIVDFTISLWLPAVIGILLCITSLIMNIATEYKQNLHDKILDIYALDLRNMHPIKDEQESQKEEETWK